MKLKIAENLSLPPDAVTQTFLIVGKRGSGKSNTAARLVEQFHRAKLPFVVLDPVDTWWGLKAGRDGEKGLDVYVFGGRKQDLPLNAGDGALIAEVLCEHRASMVLSVKHLSGRERNGFMVKFAQTLFQKWGGGPLHVVLEEAHELAPQMSGGRSSQSNEDNEAAMLGAFKRLWKLGRASGIGGSAITQRPASLSKDITTQSEILIAHRTIGPQDVDAIGQWVKYHGERLDILAELPTLPTGEAFVWAPEFPEGKAIGLVRTAVLLRETYDSASTPKVGEQRVEPKELAPVDLERLRAKMSATIDKAKAEDPRELRKQIAELRKEIALIQKLPPAPIAPPKTVEKFVLKDGQLARAEKLVEQIDRVIVSYAERVEKAVAEASTKHDAPLSELRTLAEQITGALASTHAPQPENRPILRTVPAAAVQQPRRQVSVPGAAPSGDVQGNGDLTRAAERKVLTVLAQYPQGRSTRQVAILAGYAMNGGGFRNAVGRLRSLGYLDGPGHQLVATGAGLAALGAWTPLPSGSALAQHWLSQLDRKAEREVLQALLDAYPKSLTADEAAVRTPTQYEANGGGFRNALGKLKTLELITGERGAYRASDELFSEGN